MRTWLGVLVVLLAGCPGDDGKLTGTAALAGNNFPISGTVAGDKATGTITNTLDNRQYRYEAVVKGADVVTWTTFIDGKLVTADLTRRNEAEPPKAPHDRRPRQGQHSTDIHCTFAADGTYRYGGAKTAWTGGWNRSANAAATSGRCGAATGSRATRC